MTTTPPPRLIWIDRLKAIALVWIFLNHASERLLGSPYFANPADNWPPLSERLSQLRPLMVPGIWHVPINLFRYVGWLGDQGVGLFLILSGFGLAWGYLSRTDSAPLQYGVFIRRRLNRIYPLWLAAHICLLLPLAIIGMRISLLDSAFYFSFLGIRVLPNQLYYGVPAWWFVSLILQLYLVFPFLWPLLRRWGAVKFFVIIGGLSLLIRGAGLFYFQQYLDAWSRGAIFITRLPEFAAGMAIAGWMHRRGATRAGKRLPIGIAFFLTSIAASLTLSGMTIAPLLGALGALAILYSIYNASQSQAGILNWIGRHSFSLYLVHQPFVDAFLPKVGRPMGPSRLAVGFALAAIASVAAALVLEWLASAAINFLDRARQRRGTRTVVCQLATAGAIAWGLLIAAGLVVQKWNPQEPNDLGWGERPSLQPSAQFGWSLKPSQTTHLRWESYDYHVTANSLGFPGPEYPEQKTPGALRILVTGDAFTSAEGVDTDQAWPRLLENRLAESAPKRPQVMNFAITGYGPNQYLAVVKEFAPRYHPDLILIGLFVNDYGDVLESDDEFRTEIGFDLPDPHGPAAILTFRQFGGLVRNFLLKNVYQRVLHKPDPVGYLFGQFHFLQADCPELTGDGAQLFAQRLSEIKQAAGATPVVIAMIPCAPQVCDPPSLAYWPAHVDLSDSSRFDLDLPQHVTQRIAQPLGIRCYDLRDPLRTAGNAYQPNNMHWLPKGHRAAADYLANVLRADGYLDHRP